MQVSQYRGHLWNKSYHRAVTVRPGTVKPAGRWRFWRQQCRSSFRELNATNRTRKLLTWTLASSMKRHELPIKRKHTEATGRSFSYEKLMTP